MTERELETKIYDMKSFIADKFKDIQMQAQSLKNPDEDQMKILSILTKISDDISDIKRGYSDLEELNVTVPEPEETEGGNGAFGSYF